MSQDGYLLGSSSSPSDDTSPVPRNLNVSAIDNEVTDLRIDSDHAVIDPPPTAGPQPPRLAVQDATTALCSHDRRIGLGVRARPRRQHCRSVVKGVVIQWSTATSQHRPLVSAPSENVSLFDVAPHTSASKHRDRDVIGDKHGHGDVAAASAQSRRWRELTRLDESTALGHGVVCHAANLWLRVQQLQHRRPRRGSSGCSLLLRRDGELAVTAGAAEVSVHVAPASLCHA